VIRDFRRSRQPISHCASRIARCIRIRPFLGTLADIAGVYPVSDLRTYPDLAKAAPAYELKTEELRAKLNAYNPIERAGVLAKAKVPAFIIHGDEDKTYGSRKTQPSWWSVRKPSERKL